MYTDLGLYIDGKWLNGEGRKGEDVINPATGKALARLPRLDKMLVDPPRDGAAALVRALGAQAPHRLLYVSCSPATLARDAGVLVAEKGYRLCAAGVVNMFPHTSHIESIALFERG